MPRSGLRHGYTRYSRGSAPAPSWPRKRWIRWLLVATGAPLLLAGLGWMTYQGLSRSEFFQVTGIDIEGANRLTKEQVLELSGVDIHSNLVALSGRRVRQGIESHGWVESAEVERQWPNRLTIKVRERRPVAIVNREGRLFYLDRSGYPFAPVVPPDDMDYPVISGLAPGGGDGAAKDCLAEALQFIRYAGGGNPNLPAQNISEINLSDPSDPVLFLMSRPFPIRLGRGEMKTKYDRLSQVLGGLYKRRQFQNVAYIDVDYGPGQVLVGYES